MNNEEKAPLGATIGAALRLLFLPVGLLLGALAVSGFVSHTRFMDYFMGVICALLAAVALGIGIRGIGKMSTASEDWKQYKLLKSIGPGEELSEEMCFFTVPEDDSELQQRLRRWKMEPFGRREFKIRYDDETGDVSFTFAGDYAGRAEEPVRAWIAGHFDEIQTVRSAVVRGGGHDRTGEVRPFHLAVTLQLQRPVIHPARGEDPLPPVRSAFGFDGDRVCVVTRTGKVHTCPPGCGIGDAGLPRLLLDELDEDKHSLCLKCYKDYF